MVFICHKSTKCNIFIHFASWEHWKYKKAANVSHKISDVYVMGICRKTFHTFLKLSRKLLKFQRPSKNFNKIPLQILTNLVNANCKDYPNWFTMACQGKYFGKYYLLGICIRCLLVNNKYIVDGDSYWQFLQQVMITWSELPTIPI